MNKVLLSAGMTAVLLNSLYAGGGKNIAPVAAVIAPIATEDPIPWYIGAGLILGKWYKSEQICCSRQCEFQYQPAS